MKVKLDANLGTRGHRLLVGAGHDVSTAASQGLATSSDEALIALCSAEGRALLTLDTDFANALRYPPALHAGVVVVRAVPRATAGDIETALRAVLRAVGDSPLAGRLLIVDLSGRVREYSPIED
ncbi:MAG: DUF5615 family PIN-like protein [Myxococcales bacterium]|nr:DUF5615 family PIN-like protein [Myxococcales bacterium]